MLVEIRYRTDTVENWALANPILGEGEPTYETPTGVVKVGDGIRHYLDLPAQSADPTVFGNLVAQAQAAAVAAQAAADAAAAASGGIVPATTTAQGVVELATNAEAIAGTDPDRAVTPAALAAVLTGFSGAVPDATTTVKGKVELATNAEAASGAATDLAVTPAGVAAAIAATGVATPDATTTVKGKVELATNAETTAGASGTLAVTPAGMAAAIAAQAAATTTTQGPVELATNAETVAGVDTQRATTPAGVKAYVDANPTPWGSIAGKPAVIGAGADAAAAQTALGGSTVGRAIFSAANADAAQGALGAGTVGKALIVASSKAAGRSAIDAADIATTMTLGTAQTVTGPKNFTTAPTFPLGSIDTDMLTDFLGSVDSARQQLAIPAVQVYDQGSPLPAPLPTGISLAVERAVAAADPSVVSLATTLGNNLGVDGTSFPGAISRPIVSGRQVIAVVALGTTAVSGGGAPTTFTGFGMTWTLAQDRSGNPIQGVDTPGKVGTAVFIGTGTPTSGTTFSVGSSTPMRESDWIILELADAVAYSNTAWQIVMGASTVSTAPSVAFVTPDPTDFCLAFLTQNSNTDSGLDASGSFTDLGISFIATAPSVAVKGEKSATTVSPVGFTGAVASVAKRVIGMSIPAA